MVPVLVNYNTGCVLREISSSLFINDIIPYTRVYFLSVLRTNYTNETIFLKFEKTISRKDVYVVLTISRKDVHVEFYL